MINFDSNWSKRNREQFECQCQILKPHCKTNQRRKIEWRKCWKSDEILIDAKSIFIPRAKLISFQFKCRINLDLVYNQFCEFENVITLIEIWYCQIIETHYCGNIWIPANVYTYDNKFLRNSDANVYWYLHISTYNESKIRHPMFAGKNFIWISFFFSFHFIRVR